MILGIDIFHGDNLDKVDPFKKLATQAAFVINKATQGLMKPDFEYANRRQPALDAGLLWGAYHFNTGDKIQDQVDHFFDCAKPDANTFMALDFEDNPNHNQMSLSQAVEFLAIGNKILGRKLKLYSGNSIKDTIINADAATRNFLGEHELWLCEYGPQAKLVDTNKHPLPWKEYFLWQFTGDGIGPIPHTMPGITTKGIDINRFEGNLTALKERWA